ncbi:hypothetical protein [Paenibacillus sp. UNC499MF]|uniref:hypothetical protein n=1 Tax=Paenibacillus sp. UNC499MF TaxID=1502751 RepID=UPI0008A06BEB|nr:hypothetical protein [Paenibacillus sp. UNC499MF]SEF70486.1 hypothetical protein SAMN02799616_00936 [Paenibacillus sp. UNC499MF]
MNDTATLYVNGVAAYTNLPVANAGALKAATTVKMVHSTLDNQDKNSYTNASFSNVLVQSQSGGSYTQLSRAIFLQTSRSAAKGIM